MKLFPYFVFAALSCGSMQLQAFNNPFEADVSQKDKPATIKVLLDKGLDSVLLEVKGRHTIYEPQTGLKISSGSFSKREFVKHDEKGMKWGELYPSVFEMRLVPGDPKTTVVVNGTEYRGCIEIYDLGGKFTVINEIDVENYLKTTLNTQFSRPMDDEVMEAVAIAARTNCYFYALKNPLANWHVDAKDVNYQGYGATLQNLQVERAVENTRYIIMTYQQAPFATTWTKNSAGKTTDFATVFRKNVSAPHGIEVAAAANDREKSKWTFSVSKKDLAHALGLETVSALDIFVEKSSNKVYGVRVRDRQSEKTFDFSSFQKKVGAKRLRSNDFATTLKGDSVQFTGYGEGPGVGLCLYGADKMAESGEKAPKLLSTFYPGVKIENVRALKAFNQKQEAAK
jgi:stage II sporulation protein D